MNAFVGAYLIFLWSCSYSVMVIAVVLIYITSFSKTPLIENPQKKFNVEKLTQNTIYWLY